MKLMVIPPESMIHKHLKKHSRIKDESNSEVDENNRMETNTTSIYDINRRMQALKKNIDVDVTTQRNLSGEFFYKPSSDTKSNLVGFRSKIKAQPVPMDDLHEILAKLEVAAREDQVNSSSTNYERCVDIEQCFEPDQDGDNLLMSAILHSREDIANRILDQVPNYEMLALQNTQGQNALHLAVLLNLAGLARRLVAWGTPLVSYDRNGNTPLHIACRDGKMDCVKALTTPLSPEEISQRSFYVPYYRLPQDIELRNYDGYTCFHMAALNSHYDVLDYLLRKTYANINAVDRKSGETLLHFAVHTKNIKLFSFLLKRRITDVNVARYDGLTPLDIARTMQCHPMYDLLIRAGAQSRDYEASMKTDGDFVEMEYDDFVIAGSPLL